MTARKATAPHPQLSRWVQREGTGAMKRLVEGSGRTWAAVGRVVWHGAVPRPETAQRLSLVTGIPAGDLLAGALVARARLRDADQPEAAE